MVHPRDGRTADPPTAPPRPSRRGFLARAAGTGLAAAGLGGLLDACGAGYAVPTQYKPIPLPRTNNPVKWPIFAANPPIKGGLTLERKATLRILGRAGYVSQRCLDDFARRYNCQVELTTFGAQAHALARLSRKQVSADILLGVTVGALGPLVESKLIQPLNHGYIPNIAHAWPEYHDPFYDVHWRYTVPYAVYTTGIAWRKDLVAEDPYQAVNGWAFPGQAKYRGKVAILDDYREAIGLGLLTNGLTNLNTNDPMQILTAQQSLQSLSRLTGARIDVNVAAGLGSGQTWIHQAWSGDMAAASVHLRQSGKPADLLGYWFPPGGQGPVANDTLAVARGARNPVLAHLFLNYVLDPRNALANIAFSGYTQPLTAITPARLVQEGILPASLISAAMLPSYVTDGLRELALPLATDLLWRHAWQAVRN